MRVGLRGFIRGQYRRRAQTLRLLLAVVASSVSVLLIVPAQAASIGQGFKTTDKELITGMAAALDPASGESQRVVRANNTNRAQYVGIVTTMDANFLTLTSDTANVVVATSGEVLAFVSDINGVVKKGDNLVLSPIVGVLMKADESTTQVQATALDNYITAGAVKKSVSFTGGGTIDATVNTLRVELSSKSVLSGTADADKSFLRIIGEKVTGKSLSEWQVVIAFVIFVLILVVEGSLIYGTVHSTISALGRNPLSHDAVYRQLLQVTITVLGVLAFGFATIYAILQI